MKKRKPPFVLVSILIVLVGTAVVFGDRVMVASGMRPPEPPKRATPPPSEKPIAPTTKDLVQVAKGTKKKGPRVPMVVDGPQPVADGEATQTNTVMRPQIQSTKPVPNDTQTRSHWWVGKD